MASPDRRDISAQTLARLASDISVVAVKDLAERYLGVRPEDIADIEYSRREDSKGIKREILRLWAYSTWGIDQYRTLAGILYHSGMVNPAVVFEHLQVTQEEAILPAGPGKVWSVATEGPGRAWSPAAAAGPAGPGAAGSSSTPDQSEVDAETEYLIKEVRGLTRDNMKIEMASWAKDYTVSFENMYTELTLEQLDNKPTGPQGQKVSDYRELLEPAQTQGAGSKMLWPKGKRVIVKADPGYGKTTFSKKVAHDWATGAFSTMKIVFCIFLKLVRPGTAIENIIINQYETLQDPDLGFNEKKLHNIIKSFGNECLIILDGLDEIDLDKHGDVLKVIKGKIYSRCTVVVTTRPHGGVEGFPTVVSSKGFDKERAREFLTSCLEDKSMIESVLQFNSRSFTNCDQLNSSPMLLLSVCILVNDKQISLLQYEPIPVQDVYYKLIRCLYSKFCVHEELEFSEEGFLGVIKRVGKLAWETLQSGVYWFKRSDLVRMVGEDAFRTGLIIGSHGFELASHADSEVVISFPHRTIQEFLGTWYFIHALDDGMEIESLVESLDPFKCILTTNNAVWNSSYFLDWHRRFQNKELVVRKLHGFAASTINLTQMDELDQNSLRRYTDRVILRYIYPMCHQIRELYTYVSDPAQNYFMELPNLQLVFFSDKPFPFIDPRCFSHTNDSPQDQLNVVIDHKEYDVAQVVPELFRANKKLAVHLTPKGKVTDLGDYLKENMREVHIYGSDETLVTAQRQFDPCPDLTHLCVMDATVDESLIEHLSTANRLKRLPVLQHLSFEGCGNGVKDKLPRLLESEWPELTNINLKGCYLNTSDLQALIPNPSLPKLESVAVDLAYDKSQDGVDHKDEFDEAACAMFQSPMVNIKQLQLYNVNQLFCNKILLTGDILPDVETISMSAKGLIHYTPSILETNSLPPKLSSLALKQFTLSPEVLEQLAEVVTTSQISSLDLSHSSGLTGCLSVLLGESYPTLESLTLSYCGLSPQDLTSLARASGGGRLRVLKHLDLSENKVSDHLDCLFSENCRWDELNSLKLNETDMTTSDGLEFFAQRINRGCLRSVETLRISTFEGYSFFSFLDSSLPNLRTVYLRLRGRSFHTRILNSILSAVDKQLAPVLNRVVLFTRDEDLSTFLTQESDSVFSVNFSNITDDGLDTYCRLMHMSYSQFGTLDYDLLRSFVSSIVSLFTSQEPISISATDRFPHLEVRKQLSAILKENPPLILIMVKLMTINKKFFADILPHLVSTISVHIPPFRDLEDITPEKIEEWVTKLVEMLPDILLAENIIDLDSKIARSMIHFFPPDQEIPTLSKLTLDPSVPVQLDRTLVSKERYELRRRGINVYYIQSPKTESKPQDESKSVEEPRAEPQYADLELDLD